MEVAKQNLGEFYAARAMADSSNPTSPVYTTKIHETRDMVYNGNNNSTIGNITSINKEGLQKNKKNSRRSISPFTIILLLLGTAVASVLYIGNILSVGRLMLENNQLRLKHRQILNDQELLRAQINKLSGLERIQQLASNQLGMKNPRQLPIWIELDPERLKQVEEIIQQQSEHR